MFNHQPTNEEIIRKMDAYIALTRVIAEAIRASAPNGIPSGHLYGLLMPTLSLDQYNDIISVLKQGGLVSESGHLLRWEGPASY